MFLLTKSRKFSVYLMSRVFANGRVQSQVESHQKLKK